MNRTRLIFIGILALAAGAFASVLAFRVLQSRAGASQSGGADVVVATGDIAVGTRIQDKDVRVVHVPADAAGNRNILHEQRIAHAGVHLRRGDTRGKGEPC